MIAYGPATAESPPRTGWRTRLTLVPSRRFLLWLLIGGALIALATISPLIWILAAVYLLLAAGLAGWDARRLPPVSAFRARRQLPEPLSLGATQEVRLTVTCPGAAGLRGRLADHVPPPLAADAREVPGRFDEAGEMRCGYRVRPVSRGAHRIPALDVRVVSPGGWWWRQFRLALDQEAHVYPDLIAVRRQELAFRRGLRAYAGQRRARWPGAALSLAGLREYLPGDDIRHLNWKATARRDEPVTNEYEAERGQQLVIALDCGRLMTAPAGHLTKLDHAVNAALLLAWVAQNQGDRVGLLLFSDRVHGYLTPESGSKQLPRIARMLYRVPAVYAEPEYADALSQLALRVRARSLVVLLTDVLDEGASEDLVAHALRAGRRHLLLVVAMSDPAIMEAVRHRPRTSADAYDWTAGEELLLARQRAFQVLRQGGVHCLDVEAGQLSPSLVERYLELKERALL
ncbi:MAG TPA: DUF58 domain-containing protein [Candidatus Dormibacteraeota bacterium]|nr:DUF58 domain-containing protein [Candidatus Dormibacteraeota bacterium]